MNLLTNIISFLFSLVCLVGFGQWSDSFSDGDLTNNPPWQGDLEDFTIVSGVLQLGAPTAGNTELFTEIQPDSNFEWVWEFKVRHGFSASSNNNSRIFLWSQTADFYSGETTAVSTAYYLQFGESGSSDAIELFRIDSGSTEAIFICRGIEGSISGPFENKYRITYSQSAWKIWSGGWSDPYYILESSGLDIPEFSSGYFAISLNYTASNTQKFYFDDIKTGIYSPDISPPEITGFTLINGNQLLLDFSEAVDSSATKNSHYSVNLLPPETADFTDGSQQQVLLTWTADFPPNQPLTVSIDTLWDIAGNQAINLSIDFIWNPPFEADSADILFNEVLPDPTPLVGLPEAEFIELFNASDSTIDLEGYLFYNSSVQVTLPGYNFEPGSYLILCDEDDTLLFENFSPVMGLSTWPALVNSGDSLTLLNPSGIIIDTVVYDDSWYGSAEKAEGGWSLERINPNWPCEDSDNWRASENDQGGTPGQINSIFNNAIDSIGPEILSIQIINDELLRLNLTEAPANTFLTLPQIVIPGLEIIAIEFGESPTEDLLLLLSEPITEDVNYSAKLEDVQDCWGNPSLDSLVFYSGFFAQTGDIIFNELMPDPSPPQLLPEAEFIELFNTTGHLFNANSWQLDNSGVRKAIPPFIFEPDTFIILCREQDTALFSGYGKTIGLPSWGILANTNDSLGLINEKGELIAQVVYNNSWYKDENKNEGGWSLERINPEVDCNGFANWMASKNTSGGTPGNINSANIFEIENSIRIWQAFLPDSTILTTSFSGEPDTVSIYASIYQTTPELDLILKTTKLTDDGFDLTFDLSKIPKVDTVYHFSISKIKSCNQVEIETQNIEFGKITPAKSLDIVINEILFHPFSGSSDFLELMNVSSHFIDLKNWRILKSDGFEIKEETILSNEHLILSPGELLAFSPLPEELNVLYPISTDRTKLFHLSRLPNFTNDQGTIILKDNFLNTIDSMYYSEDMHFSLLDDLKGISLERIVPTGSSTDPLNWTSASETVGFATPGMQNSQLFKPSASGQVLLEPELFTPDNDGYHDQLHILYKLSSGGWMGTIRIYSDRGIEIRRLLNNDWLGTEGSKAWDGTDNNGEKAPVGIYIVYFELFNAQGEKQSFKQTCVLGSKL